MLALRSGWLSVSLAFYEVCARSRMTLLRPKGRPPTGTCTSADCPPSADVVIHQLGVQTVASLKSGCTQRFAVDPAAWNDTVCAATAATDSRYCLWPCTLPSPRARPGPSRESHGHPSFLPRGMGTKSWCNPQLAASGAVGRRSGRTASALAAQRNATCQPAAQRRLWHTAVGARGSDQPTHASPDACS